MPIKERKNGVVWAVMAALCIVGALAIMPATFAAGIPSDLVTLARGYQSGIVAESDMVLVVNTMDELVELVQALGIDLDPSTIDIEKVTVMAAIAGPRPSSGFEVEIRGLFPDEKGGFVIDVQETAPAESCDVLTVETRPFHLVMSPVKVDDTLARFDWETMSVACP